MSPEPISPELVLVDPELAARARAALPWGPTSYAPAAPRTAPVRRPEPTRAGRAITVRVPVGATLWLLGGTAILLTLAFGALPSSGDRPRLLPATAAAESARPAQPARPPAASPPAAEAPTKPQAEAPAAPAIETPIPTTAIPRRPAPKQPAARQAAPKARTEPAAPAAPTPPPARQRPAPKPGFQPARVFGWAPQAGASYYHVVFLRGGRPFYEAWPRLNRLPLPARVRFRPGRYTWIVEPGTGTRSAGQFGSPIVKSSFTVGG